MRRWPLILGIAAAQAAQAAPPFGVWGMSPGEIEAASKGTAPRTTGAEQQRLGALLLGNLGQQEIAGIEVMSNYYYLLDQLAMVLLVPVEQQHCTRFRSFLHEG